MADSRIMGYGLFIDPMVAAILVLRYITLCSHWNYLAVDSFYLLFIRIFISVNISFICDDCMLLVICFVKLVLATTKRCVSN